MAKDLQQMEKELNEALAKEERQRVMEEEWEGQSKEERVEHFINRHLAENPREMTSEFQVYLKEYAPGKTLTHLVAPLLLVGILMLVALPIWDDLRDGRYVFGMSIFAVGLVGIPLAFVLHGIMKRRRMLPQYSKVLTDGRVSDAEVLNIEGGEHSVRRGEARVSQTIVQLRLNGELITQKGFDSDIHKCYDDGPTLKVLWHPDHPGVIIPVQHLMDQVRLQAYL